MKTLTDHTIIYDDECPFCKAYSNAFVKTGLLDKNGRIPYSVASDNIISNIDWARARNEIALVNRIDKSVLYGIDSMLYIAGYSFPIFKPFFNLKLFRFLVGKLYFFISFNRKVIMPGKFFEANNACIPDFKFSYRLTYILLAWLITSFVLVSYSRLIVPVIPESNLYREFMVCGGQIIFQGIIVALVKKTRLIHYLGNLMTVSLGGAILLLPIFLLTTFTHSPFLYAGYFILVAGLMFFEHARRVKILELPWFISATWVLYRLLVLFIIL